jgi:SAM-dependent methyltransferase
VSGLLLAAARPEAGERVLDIGCGAGAQTFALARAVGPDGAVTGVHFSAPLLARARERQDAVGAGNITFRQADAQTDDLGEGVFDLIASRFGVMFFDQPVVAFSNLATALRPGGRMAFVTWQGPEANPWFTLPHRLAVARLGEVAPAPPDAPGPMAFRDTERVLDILAAAGFVDCKADEIATELHHPGGVEAATMLATQIGPVSRVLREKHGTDADREAIGAELVSSFERYRTADGIRVPAGVLIYTARKA